jgi:azurin
LLDQKTNVMRRTLLAIALGLTTFAGFCMADEAPQIFLDKSPRVVAYQLKRLNNQQLTALERHDDQAKYKPIYEALLTRKGLDRKFREEAVGALSKLDKSDPVVEILDGIGKADPDDKGTQRELVGLLMAQKPASLAAQQQKLRDLAAGAEIEQVKSVAYAALAVADAKPDQAWQLASEKGGVKALLNGLPWIPDPKARAAFYERVKELVDRAADQPSYVAAIDALSAIPGHENEEFKTLAQIVSNSRGAIRDAAARSIRRVPVEKWPQDQIEPLANDVVKLVEQIPADQRTSPSAVQLVQLGNDLAGELPDEQGLAVRKTLRGLGVRVVVIRTLREQMQYDTRFFAVQAGKPVQVVLENEDAMPHNFVITAPGAMQEIAVAAGQMQPPADPNAKSYVPDSPKVLESLTLVQPDESASLSFTAPTTPGEYDYVCTFPGHWVRMYGVMLVVPDLDAWEKDPKPPLDPLTKKPMESQKNAAGPAMAHEH